MLLEPNKLPPLTDAQVQVSASEINATSDWRRPQSAVPDFRNTCDCR